MKYCLELITVLRAYDAFLLHLHSTSERKDALIGSEKPHFSSRFKLQVLVWSQMRKMNVNRAIQSQLRSPRTEQHK